MKYEQKVKEFKIKKDAIILGIETSCDETAVAVIKNGREILADEIISSATEHVKYGGVVPEIASRAHTNAIYTATKNAMQKSGLSFDDIDAIAVTEGAGLLGALLVGVSFAKALAFALNKPLIPVSHIRGHLAAAYLTDKSLEPPFITILASGGHTAILKVNSYTEFTLLGSTIDDAVGEAIDKVARVLGLTYPGGPNLERLALEGKDNVPLPKMLKNYVGSIFDFSYSGLKTAVINYVNTANQRGERINKADVACSFQKSAIGAIISRAEIALKETGYKTLTISGGVGANGYLREELSKLCANLGVKLVMPEKRYCTDNGAMIGAEGYIQYINGNFADLTLNAKAVIPLSEILK